MPVYAFKGYDAGGRSVSGTRDADSPRTIKQLLRRDGIFITELAEHGQKKEGGLKLEVRFNFMKERVSTQDLAVATRQAQKR